MPIEAHNLQAFQTTGQLLFNEPLSGYTTWHIGGNAKYYFRPQNSEDLSSFLKQFSKIYPNESLTFLGLGSNVLISDQGIEGLVIHTLGMNNFLESVAEVGVTDLGVTEVNKVVVKVGAGVPCAKLAKFAAKQGLIGAEFFAGIPGTIGGALTMNAGAFGGETWRVVEKVETINPQGEIFTRTPEHYQIEYRSVKPKMLGVSNAPGAHSEYFLTGYFHFEKGDTEIAAQKIKQLLKKRNETQPIGSFNCGSVFKNPANDYSARLIEACGLKGFKSGNAQISPIHANFIINLGGATAQEILSLMQRIITTVYQQHGVQLIPEVRFLGFEEAVLQEYLHP